MTITYHAGRRIQGLSTDIVETLTLNEDFSSDNWTDASTLIQVNTSTGVLDWDADSSSNQTSYRDLGSALSTSFVLRSKLVIDSISYSTSDSVQIYLGLFDSTSGANVAQDGFAFYIMADTSSSNGLKYRLRVEGAPSAIQNTAGEAQFSRTPSAETLYLELVRNGDTFTINLYSDSSFSANSLLESKSATEANVTGLQYLAVKNYLRGGSGGTLNGTWDDVKIYDGVSSLSSKPTNVQSGSRFEETDTRKIYYLDSSYPVSSDSLGTAVDGTATGITKTNTGKIGSNCWSFANSYVDSGNPDYVSVSNTLEDSWYSAGELTINFWVYRNNTNYGGVITVYDDGTNRGIEFFLNSDSAIQVTNQNSSNLISANNSVPTNTWTMITLTIDVDKSTQTDVKAKLWINGSSAVTTDTFQFNTRSSNVYIGTLSHANGKGYGMNGKLDDISFWNRPLTSTEIGYLYNSGTGRSIPQAITDNNLSTSGLLAYYDFEETSGNLINKAVTSTVWNEES